MGLNSAQDCFRPRTNFKIAIDKSRLCVYNILCSDKCGFNSVVECHLAKVKVARSNRVTRSIFNI